jgi:pimeloyl-ACP methyl ester carboxylesterase
MTARIISLLTATVLVTPPANAAPQAGVESFDSNGVQIHYVDKGRGVPVVLLHGFTGSYEVSRDSLRATTLPVLAISGEHDRGLEAVKRMAGVVRGMEVVQIPGASHASSVRPSAEPLVAFLDKYRSK